MSCSDRHAPRRAHRLAALAGLTLAGGVLAGCAETPPGPVSLLPTEHYNIQVTSHPQQMALGQHPDGLSPTQKAAIGQFVAEWRQDGGGVVAVRLPAVGDPRLARRMGDQTAAYVHQLGVPGELVRVDGYAPPPGAPPAAPILLSYDRFEAQGPNCGGDWDNLMPRISNDVSHHFGCAVTANLAAEIANPRDLLAPAVSTPADDGRREVVLDKYRKGDATSSAKDDQASGHVSDASQ